MQLQGSGNKQLENVAYIFYFKDELQLQLRKTEETNYSMFATLKTLAQDKKYDASKANIQESIKTHVYMLIDDLNRLIPRIFLKNLKLIKN